MSARSRRDKVSRRAVVDPNGVVHPRATWLPRGELNERRAARCRGFLLLAIVAALLAIAFLYLR